jgi:hypothetical protein
MCQWKEYNGSPEQFSPLNITFLGVYSTSVISNFIYLFIYLGYNMSPPA